MPRRRMGVGGRGGGLGIILCERMRRSVGTANGWMAMATVIGDSERMPVASDT